MSVAGGGGVFVSYRREGGGDAAGRLADRLVDRLGAERVFMDVDAIEPGMDYVEAITRAVAACDVLVAVIGPGWLAAAGDRGRRLDDPYDWVRVEVGTALARNVRVIPVLVGGAVMPTRDELPEELAGLARRNALRIRHESFRADAGQLVAVVERVLASALPVALSTDAAMTADQVTDGATGHDSRARKDNEARAIRLLADAERIANSITDEDSKAEALTNMAQAVAATDPGRAARLFGDAERIANSITDEDSKAGALYYVVLVAAATDLGRAERIANSITDEYMKESALSEVAGPLAATDPGRAERIANSITDEYRRDNALRRMAGAVAATDLDRAERIIDSITSESTRVWALSDVAERASGHGPWPRRAHHRLHHQGAPEIKGAARCGGSGSGHRPGPRHPAFQRCRAHRQLHHRQRALEGSGAEQRGESRGGHRPQPRHPAFQRCRAHRQLHHRRGLEGRGAARGGESGSGHRPGPRRAHHRPHHRRGLEGMGAARRGESGGGHRPGPRRAHRQLHHQRILEGIGASGDRGGAQLVLTTEPDRQSPRWRSRRDYLLYRNLLLVSIAAIGHAWKTARFQA